MQKKVANHSFGKIGNYYRPLPHHTVALFPVWDPEREAAPEHRGLCGGEVLGHKLRVLKTGLWAESHFSLKACESKPFQK